MAHNLGISIGFQTDIGQQRSHNEDTAAVFDLPGAQAAFLVCDGMGGLRAGDVASREAARVVADSLKHSFVGGVPADPLAALRTALIRANDAVNALNRTPSPPPSGPDEDDPTVRGSAASTGAAVADALMGTTCVAGVIIADVLYLGHAGDSRAYLWRRGELIRLTEDHSYVAERVRAGDISEAEARTSRFRNVITRAIGIDATVDPDVRSEPLKDGDGIILCSDGLTTMVEDVQIGDALRAPALARATPERIAAALVDAANRAGGQDNITVLFLRAGGGDSSALVSDAAGPRRRSTSRSATPSATKQRTTRGGIVDIDAPRRKRPVSPIGLLIMGAILCMIGLSGVVLLVPGARHRVARLLLGQSELGSGEPGQVAMGGAVPDFRDLTYDPPQRFSGILARGDLLAYSRHGGLYFVRDSTGDVMSLSRSGEPLQRPLTSVDVVSPPSDTPSTHIFMTADPQGNIYISHTKNQTVEKRDPTGKLLLTLKGFDHPEAIAVDEDGNIYVIDFNLIKILRVHWPSSAAAANHVPATNPPSAAPSAPATVSHSSSKPAPAASVKKSGG